MFHSASSPLGHGNHGGNPGGLDGHQGGTGGDQQGGLGNTQGHHGLRIGNGNGQHIWGKVNWPVPPKAVLVVNGTVVKLNGFKRLALSNCVPLIPAIPLSEAADAA